MIPHNVNESLLYVAVSYSDDTLEMPPKYKLPDAVIADFKRWIELGAPDPRIKNTKPTKSANYTSTIDVEKGRASHWAYRKPQSRLFKRQKIPAIGPKTASTTSSSPDSPKRD